MFTVGICVVGLSSGLFVLGFGPSFSAIEMEKR